MKAQMVFFDCDGTLIEANLWPTLEKVVGMNREKTLTWFSDYYEGRTDFETLVNKLNESYRGKLTEKLFHEVMDTFNIYPEAYEITQFLREQQIPMAIISSGDGYYISRVAKHLGIEIWHANTFMRFDEAGNFIKMDYTVEDPSAKTNQIRQICTSRHINPINTIFVGDSYNDIAAFRLTTHGILYQSREEDLMKEAWKHIDNLNEIKYLLDI